MPQFCTLLVVQPDRLRTHTLFADGAKFRQRAYAFFQNCWFMN
jgi:hypothetical protein